MYFCGICWLLAIGYFSDANTKERNSPSAAAKAACKARVTKHAMLSSGTGWHPMFYLPRNGPEISEMAAR